MTDFDINQGNITIFGTLPVWTSDLDAINSYNNERTLPEWSSNEQYKYQSDGTTLGGEGPYISYTFIEQVLDGSTISAITTIKDAPNVDIS